MQFKAAEPLPPSTSSSLAAYASLHWSTAEKHNRQPRCALISPVEINGKQIHTLFCTRICNARGSIAKHPARASESVAARLFLFLIPLFLAACSSHCGRGFICIRTFGRTLLCLRALNATAGRFFYPRSRILHRFPCMPAHAQCSPVERERQQAAAATNCPARSCRRRRVGQGCTRGATREN